ncbi:TPA: hypothetical protein P0E04_001036 [Vibrio campbellii]|jgi:hypothetical protein|uniref:Uncharacterized protein n=1 Tax=Vibrio campbellii TaxID=680 RepID=A0AAE9N0C8_9VIBR|nr:hypothetical protein [Vibrio campbellii]AXB33655.1 hypothetical protein DSB67_19735 [Vibrio campbellii]UTZ23965.1 hypothetical protein HB760_19525 [Vibrio campbellii]UTZ28230.1 hypothetical protein HB761_16050 [Vibrio campbellii]UTZ33902.1 hypothetical protein HB762_21920 [Vibrio campbellii]UTZ39074.1 hypothetical protein HB763_21155 [Vibrio campbellii]
MKIRYLFLMLMLPLVPYEVLAAATENIEQISGSIDLTSVESTASDVGITAVAVSATVKAVGIIKNVINQA